jgi:hypothetical protein
VVFLHLAKCYFVSSIRGRAPAIPALHRPNVLSLSRSRPSRAGHTDTRSYEA